MYISAPELAQAVRKAGTRAKKKGLNPEVCFVDMGDKSGAMEDGNFTMCFVMRNGNFYMGVAKRNAEDSHRPETGLAIAARRLVYNSISPKPSSTVGTSININPKGV